MLWTVLEPFYINFVSVSNITQLFVILTFNHTVDFMVRGNIIFMRVVDITRDIGRVLLKVEPVLGTEIAIATLVQIQGQKQEQLSTKYLY